MAILLVASYDPPGEYVLLDADTREVVFGPFRSHPNALIVETQVRRQLQHAHEVRFEWAPQTDCLSGGYESPRAPGRSGQTSARRP